MKSSNKKSLRDKDKEFLKRKREDKKKALKLRKRRIEKEDRFKPAKLTY